MLLGWGPRDGAEIRPYQELEALFRLEDVSRAPAFFDVQKLASFNGDYIRALTVADFTEACQPWLVAPYAPWAPEEFDAAVFRSVAGLAQSRVTVLGEITTYVDWLFLARPPEDEASWVKAMTPGAQDILASVRKNWTDADWTFEALRAGLQAAAAEHGLKLGKAQAPVRVAVTGRTVGLPLFQSVEVFGRERTLARIDAAATKLSRHSW
jgi:glutamyl-tRNA synthetase